MFSYFVFPPICNCFKNLKGSNLSDNQDMIYFSIMISVLDGLIPTKCGSGEGSLGLRREQMNRWRSDGQEEICC